ncbi:transmembrane channel-like protein [Elysia marginata]|uniref:Transmembrane channel-like protein n=1 Tax=Elysia marginata TaxID=1093978 RepID=A0AAV4GEE3_9GAST|nr:transmembrane channel-like protein [Elysia marginata]
METMCAREIKFRNCVTEELQLERVEEPRFCCWENKVGQQILQLVFLDLISQIFIRLGKTLALALFVKHCKSDKLGKPSFQVSRLYLDLVYGQCLVWLGLYFMPTLSLLVAIGQVIIFYLTYWISLTCCAPPVNIFRASRSGTFNLFVLAASLFICMMPMAIGVMELEPSASCGPYKPDLRVYDTLVEKIGRLPGWLSDAVHFISTPAFVLPVVIVLLFLVCYYRAKSVTHKEEADLLRDYLSYTRKVEMRRIVAFNRDNKG